MTDVVLEIHRMPDPPAAVQDPRSEGSSTCQSNKRVSEKAPAPYAGGSSPVQAPLFVADARATLITRAYRKWMVSRRHLLPLDSQSLIHPGPQEEEAPVAKRSTSVKVSDRHKGAPSWKELEAAAAAERAPC